MRRVTHDSTLVDVCFAVCSELSEAGVVAVLTGGSAATFYAPQRYQSLDADFVITINAAPKAAARALQRLQFQERGGVYLHPDSKFSLDFVSPPLAVGADILYSWDTKHRKDELLHVISRTDCVRDRLAAFYHWADRSSLAVAVAVANSGPIDLKVVERWSTREGASTKFQEFARRLQS